MFDRIVIKILLLYTHDLIITQETNTHCLFSDKTQTHMYYFLNIQHNYVHIPFSLIKGAICKFDLSTTGYTANFFFR